MVQTWHKEESFSGDKEFEAFEMAAPEVGSAELSMTGNPSGAVALQISNFNGKKEDIPDHRWTVVTGSQQSVAASGSFFFDLRSVGAKWYRIVFDGSGDGVGTVDAIGKGE